MHQSKCKQKKILFIACCPVSLRIAKVLRRTLNKFDCNYKIVNLTEWYSQITPIFLDKKTNIFNKISQSVKIFFNKKISYVKYVIDNENPDLVIVGDDGGICASAVRICKIKGIPTLAIQVGLLIPITNDIYNFLRYKGYLLWRIFSKILDIKIISKVLLKINWRLTYFEWGSSNADIIAVASKYDKEILVKKGIPPHKIVITGYVLADEIVDYLNLYNQINKRVLLDKYELNQQKKIILLITQAFVEDALCTFENYIKVLSDIISSINTREYQLVIKPHPRETDEKYKMLQKKFKSKDIKIVSKEGLITLIELILLSSVSVTFNSTSGLLVFICKKPLITLDLLKLHIKSPFKEYPLNVSSIRKFNSLLNQLKENGFKSINGSNYKEIYKLDGKASLRIAKIILNFMNYRENKK